MKRSVFDLMKISFLKRLSPIFRFNDQNLFTVSNLANWFSSYVSFVQVVISQLKLLGGVEK